MGKWKWFVFRHSRWWRTKDFKNWKKLTESFDLARWILLYCRLNRREDYYKVGWGPIGLCDGHTNKHTCCRDGGKRTPSQTGPQAGTIIRDSPQINNIRNVSFIPRKSTTQPVRKTTNNSLSILKYLPRWANTLYLSKIYRAFYNLTIGGTTKTLQFWGI